MAQNGDGSLERLRRKLYARGLTAVRRDRRILTDQVSTMRQDFPHEAAPITNMPTRRKAPTLMWFLWGSIGFFLLSLVVGAVFFFAGSNVVSTQNIDISVQGPTTIAGGEELALQIAIHNRNSIPIELADLIIEYPEGTRSATDLATQLPRYRESLGTIASGEVVRRTERAVLFGPEGSEQSITVTVEYRIANSNAIFYTEKEYPITISTSPLSLVVGAPQEAVSGQSLGFTIDVTSNSDTVIRNALLVAQYPFGFTLRSATPQPAYSGSIWSLGDIPPRGTRKVTFSGTMEGQDNEERIFRFSTGVAKEADERALSATFITLSHAVIVTRPFIGLTLAVNGSQDAEPAVSAGRSVRVDITWANNLTTPIYGARIEARVSGNAFEKGSVSVENGFFRSIDNTVLWDSSTNPDLATVQPGGTGRVSFTFLPSSLGAIRNPQVAISVGASGQRVSETSVPEEITASVTRTIKVNSDFAASGRIAYISGPLPPKAEQPTKYRVTLEVRNSANQVGDAQVSVSLPSYVKFLNALGDEQISFGPVGGTVVWQAGNVSSSLATARTAQFEIEFTPSVSQIGTTPILVSEPRATGIDRFTGKPLEVTGTALTTRVTDGYVPGSETVQQ